MLLITSLPIILITRVGITIPQKNQKVSERYDLKISNNVGSKKKKVFKLCVLIYLISKVMKTIIRLYFIYAINSVYLFFSK